jgi:DNA end-binding protein Ku
VARPIWKGTLSFGLLEIPVTLRSAERPNELHFTFLDRRDLSPVGYKRVNKTTGEEVPWADIVRGYEHEDGKYVVLTDEDFKRANVESTRRIDVVAFVDAKEIDPVFYERPYFVEPIEKESKGYALLREVLRRTGRVGVAKIVMREREHVAALLVRDRALVLDLLRFAEELRDPDRVAASARSLKALEVREKEVEPAEKLVEGMASSFHPEQFHDEYRHDLLALVDKKIRSGKAAAVTEPADEEEEPRGNDVADLIRLLKRSVAATSKVRRSTHPRAARSRSHRSASEK